MFISNWPGQWYTTSYIHTNKSPTIEVYILMYTLYGKDSLTLSLQFNLKLTTMQKILEIFFSSVNKTLIPEHKYLNIVMVQWKRLTVG